MILLAKRFGWALAPRGWVNEVTHAENKAVAYSWVKLIGVGGWVIEKDYGFDGGESRKQQANRRQSGAG